MTLDTTTPQRAASYAIGRYLEHPTERNRIAAEVKAKLAGMPAPSAPVPRMKPVTGD